jgi:hypothetical protein
MYEATKKEKEELVRNYDYTLDQIIRLDAESDEVRRGISIPGTCGSILSIRLTVYKEIK